MGDLQRTDHDSEHGRWTLFRRAPSPLLAACIHEMQGYYEAGGAAIVRKEIPSSVVPLILIFGDGFTLNDSRGAIRRLERSFIAGLHQRHVLVGSRGSALCMQVDFTPLGARRFLGIDLDDIADSVTDLNAILGSFADRLEERLAETGSWNTRFDLLEAALLARMRDVADHPLARAGWAMLAQEGGDIRIEQVARRLNCSPKHLISVFRQHIGLPPKAVARILRFERAVAEFGTGRHATMAELAASCGYADQAHFNREFVALSGETPRALRARILPDGTGIMAEGW